MRGKFYLKYKSDVIQIYLLTFFTSALNSKYGGSIYLFVNIKGYLIFLQLIKKKTI